jgi:hypothetical protein
MNLSTNSKEGSLSLDKEEKDPKEEKEDSSDLLMKRVKEKAEEYKKIAKENPSMAKEIILICLGLWWL